MEKFAPDVRLYRDKLISDPYRPAYHFAIPDGNGRPGDPNGAFWADGRYHLMYLYENVTTNAFHWGHISSRDLLHWRSHPDALTVENGDRGCFSGGAFVDDDGTAYLTFWKFAAKDESGDNGGIDVACARPPYDEWTRIRPIAIEGCRDPWGTVDIEHDGIVDHVSCADPSNIWKMNGWYYMQTGNLCVLNKYGREPDSEERYRGDWTDLFRSKDLKTWTFVHRFYENPRLGEDWPDATEDDMCPSFLPLPDKDGKPTGKWLQVFIAHNKGGQYYLGELHGEHFFPEQHGRFSWKDNTCFAPEALIDGKGRQIVWFWLTDNVDELLEKHDWTGVYSFPRSLWYEDAVLHMAPAEELSALQYNGQTFAVGQVGSSVCLPVKNGESFRLRAVIDMKNASRAGFTVRADEESGEGTEIYVDAKEGVLVMDTSRSGAHGRRIRETAPFALRPGEQLTLDVFVDKSVVEVYANERQAICRRIYPTHPDKALSVCAASDGADFGTVQAWEMDPTNLY